MGKKHSGDSWQERRGGVKEVAWKAEQELGTSSMTQGKVGFQAEIKLPMMASFPPLLE